MTKQFFTIILIFGSVRFINLTQKILNLIFKLFSKKNKYFLHLKEIKNGNDLKSQVIYESNSLLDTKLAHYVTAHAFNSMGFKNIFFYNMSINSFYNPNTFFFYNKLRLNYINYNLDLNQIKKSVKLFFQLRKKVVSKDKLINLRINKLEIGDLIYDSYLRFAKKPTLDLNDIKFDIEFFKCIATFVFWNDYFKKNKVDSFIQSHANYRIGIPGKIALSKNIKVFNVNIDDIYRLSKKKKYLGLQFLNYKKSFNSINNKKKLIKIAQKKMEIRFRGGNGFDIPHTFKHAFKNNSNLNIGDLFVKNRKNILISCHDFTDSPNAYGKFIFKDFLEWVEFLGEYSKNNKRFNWYLKPHPNPVNNEDKIIFSILKKYPHFKLIPAKVSHKKIIPNIDLVLTCRGTIGYEYPYFDIPVIMASNLSKVTNFKFAHTAKNLKNYKYFLKNIPKIINENNINKEEIAEFYFTHYYFYDASSWIIKNYFSFYNKKFKKNQIGSSRILPEKIFSIFFDLYKSKIKLINKSKIFINFYKSKNYKLIYNIYKN